MSLYKLKLLQSVILMAVQLLVHLLTSNLHACRKNIDHKEFLEGQYFSFNTLSFIRASGDCGGQSGISLFWALYYDVKNFYPSTSLNKVTVVIKIISILFFYNLCIACTEAMCLI